MCGNVTHEYQPDYKGECRCKECEKIRKRLLNQPEKEKHEADIEILNQHKDRA